MLIPGRDGHYTSDGMKVVHYYAMVDGFHRVIEAFTTEDGQQYVNENEWKDMNDIEKYVCRQRGWNLDKYFPDEESDKAPSPKV